ncbi:MAG: hypothetical protein HY052_04185 [Proteobacteria bacterium]|nr:hypothetical protein [Pseudomonadota bacterium]
MAFFLPKKRVLLAGNEGIALFGPTSNNGIEREIVLSWEVPNFNEQLTNALTRQNRGCAVLILFDAEHVYRKGEGFPKLSFFDRPLFIKRKLDQAFPNYPIRASFEIAAAKRTSEQKEQPSYLFVAISETNRLDKVTNSILEAGVPVAGLGLLPVESEGLVTTLSTNLFGRTGHKSRWAVLISQHETGGLRQVVIKDSRLALTRMTPVSEAGLQGAGWVDEVIREFKATLTYIARFGYVPSEGLDVIVIGGEAEKQLFEQQKFLPGSNFQCVKVAEALSSIGARSNFSSDDNFGDALHASWASKKRSLTAPIKVASLQRIRWARLAARTISVVLFISLLALTGFIFNMDQNYYPLKETRDQKKSQQRFLALEYDQESKAFDAFPVTPNTIKQTLAVNDLLDSGNVNVTPILHLLHGVLGNDIKMDEINFEYQPPQALVSATDKAPPPNGSNASRGTVKIQLWFYILGTMTPEQREDRAKRLEKRLTGIFYGYDVQLKSSFIAKPTNGGIFSGEIGKTEVATATSSDNRRAEIDMQGAPL